jgi:hypothetical protein
MGNGSDGGGGGDMSMSMGGGDMTMSMGGDMTGGAMCDPVQQNCTDPNNPKCGLVVTGTGMNRMVTGQCEPNGTTTRDMMCMLDMTTGMDDCVKGTRCTATGLPMGSSPVCRKFCGADGDCGTGQSCRASLGFGVCIPSCTPFGTDCGAGATCATTQTDVASTMTKPVRFLSCRASGTTPLWGTCAASTDCGDNAVCPRGTQVCTPLCDGTHACPDMPNMADGGSGDGGTTPTTCMPNGLPNGGGVCG